MAHPKRRQSKTLVKNYFGKEPSKGVNPDEVVAVGAAIQGAVILESGKTHDGSGNSASPDKDKKTPSPISLVSHRGHGRYFSRLPSA